jgi:hypothetical protein
MLQPLRLQPRQLLRVRVVERERGFAQRSRSGCVFGCDVLHSTTDHALTRAKKIRGLCPAQGQTPAYCEFSMRRQRRRKRSVSDTGKRCVSDTGKSRVSDTDKRRVSER